MGSLFTTIQKRIVILGFDASGKTTFLYMLKNGKITKEPRQIGFNYESIHYNNIEYHFWDILGTDKNRKNWEHFYANVNCIIFVVDSSDKYRLEDVCFTLHNDVLNNNLLKDVPFLFLYNKRDLSNNILTKQEISDALKISDIKQKYYIIETTLRDIDSVNKCMEWIHENI